MRASVCMLAAVAVASPIAVAHAQVSSADQACIRTFNAGVRDVAKQHGKIVARCLRSYASGTLATTVNACVLTDQGGRIQRATDKAIAKTSAACAGTPAFGVTPIGPALARAALGEIELLRGAMGIDLDAVLIPTALDANCQSRVAGALLKCADMRRKSFTKCQKAGLATGAITECGSLAAACLGTGDATQPDGNGAIGDMLRQSRAHRRPALRRRRSHAGAFPACDTSDPSALAACLAGESALPALRSSLNDVDGLARDCDRFDDGNGAQRQLRRRVRRRRRAGGARACDDGDLSRRRRLLGHVRTSSRA